MKMDRDAPEKNDQYGWFIGISSVYVSESSSILYFDNLLGVSQP